MILTDIQAVVLSALKAELTTIKSAECYPGQLTREELRLVALQAPALRLNLHDTREIKVDGTGNVTNVIDARLWLVTKDASDASRDQQMSDFFETLIMYLSHRVWAHTNAKKILPSSLRTRTQDANADQMRVAIGVVSWEQPLLLPKV